MKLITRGIKGVDHELSFERLNLITGPNGSGKSTAADSIRFGALGYIPALGKRPVDTAALMHNGSMSVELVLDDGRTVRRSLERYEKGFIAGAEASWLRNAKPTETAKEILKLFGLEEQDVAESLDIRELLAATPNQRAARIQQLLEAGRRTAQETSTAVARFTVWRLIPNLPEDRMPANYLEALPMVTERHKNVLKDQAGILQAKLMEAGLQGALTWANEEKRDAATGLKQKEGAAHELRKRAVEVPEPDPRDIQRLGEEKTRLHRELGAVQERAAAWGQRSRQRTELQSALGTVKASAARAAEKYADATAVYGKAIPELEAESAKAIKEIELMEAPTQPDDAAAKAIEKEAEELRARAFSITLPGVPNTREEEHRVALVTERLEAALETAKNSKGSELLEIAQELEDVSQTKGIKKALAKPIKRLRDIGREMVGVDPADLRHELDVAKTELSRAQGKVKHAKEMNDRAQGEYDILLAQAEEKGRQARKLRQEIEQVGIQVRNSYQTTLRGLLDKRQDLERRLATSRQLLQAAEMEDASAKRLLASIENQLAGAGDPGPAPEGLDQVQAKARTVGQGLEQLLEAQGIHKEIHRAIAAIEEAEAARDVFAAIEWALQRQREVEISESGGVLLGTIRDFLKAAGRDEVPFIRAAAGSCTIGWTTPENKEIQIQALSGGEWCLFAAALTAAVILARPAQVKILLVEAGETDSRHLVQLMLGISAVAKGLTAALVMAWRPVDETNGWNVIRTEYARV